MGDKNLFRRSSEKTRGTTDRENGIIRSIYRRSARFAGTDYLIGYSNYGVKGICLSGLVKGWGNGLLTGGGRYYVVSGVGVEDSGSNLAIG